MNAFVLHVLNKEQIYKKTKSQKIFSFFNCSL